MSVFTTTIFRHDGPNLTRTVEAADSDAAHKDAWHEFPDAAGVLVEPTEESKPASREPLFIVRGRSIGGTVYCSAGDGAYHWCSEKADALPMSHTLAETTIKRRIERNRQGDADSAIGRLEAVPYESKPAESAETEKRHVGYIDMTPTWAECARIYAALIERGDAKGRQTAFEGLEQMASICQYVTDLTKAGTRLKNGAFVLQRRPLPDGLGKVSAEIVLCFVPGNEATPFVTWQRNLDDESTYWGHYFGPADLGEAVTDFAKRGR